MIAIKHLFDPENLQRQNWLPFKEGVEICELYQEQGCTKAALLRYQPGATVPKHLHQGLEYLLYLQGGQQDEHGSYMAGEFVINPTGTSHSIASEHGCILLAIWEKPVKFL